MVRYCAVRCDVMRLCGCAAVRVWGGESEIWLSLSGDGGCGTASTLQGAVGVGTRAEGAVLVVSGPRVPSLDTLYASAACIGLRSSSCGDDGTGAWHGDAARTKASAESTRS